MKHALIALTFALTLGVPTSVRAADDVKNDLAEGVQIAAAATRGDQAAVESLIKKASERIALENAALSGAAAFAFDAAGDHGMAALAYQQAYEQTPPEYPDRKEVYLGSCRASFTQHVNVGSKSSTLFEISRDPAIHVCNP